MKQSNTAPLLLFAAISCNALADTANCTIEVEDVNFQVESKTAAKFVVEHTFEFSSGSGMQRKHFELTDGRYLCTLAFSDLDHGTALSCEKKDDLGHTYAQSDRSAINERAARNNLIFRDGGSHFILNAVCK